MSLQRVTALADGDPVFAPLAKLKAEGKVRRVGSAKTGYWEVLPSDLPD